MRDTGVRAGASRRQGRGVFAEAWTIGKAVGQAMRITFVNFFRKPVTVHYPAEKRVRDLLRPLEPGCARPTPPRPPVAHLSSGDGRLRCTSPRSFSGSLPTS